MIALNIFLGILELAALTFGIYYFMAHTERTIFRPRWCYIVAFGIYNVCMVLCGPVFRDDRISIFVGIAGTALIGHFLFNPGWRYLIYYVFCMVCIFLCQTTIIWGVQGIAGNGVVLREPLLYANICLMLKIMAEIGICLLLSVLSGKRKMAKLTRGQEITMFLLPVSSIILMFSLYIMGDLYMQLYGMGLLAFNFGLLLFVNVYFFYLMGYMFQSRNLEHELELFRTQSGIQFQYYQDLERRYQESRKSIHDMKNHLQAVERLYQSREEETARAYVEDLYHMLNVLGERYYAEHKMLNIILNDKLGKAEREGIQVQASIGDARLGGMKDIDVTTLFANLLDNAIEAAAGCGKEAFLHIKMDEIHDFTVIRIVNSRRGEKERKGHMGLGLENVKNVLERYHGTIQTESLPSEYRVSITLPKEGE